MKKGKNIMVIHSKIKHMYFCILNQIDDCLHSSSMSMKVFIYRSCIMHVHGHSGDQHNNVTSTWMQFLRLGPEAKRSSNKETNEWTNDVLQPRIWNDRHYAPFSIKIFFPLVTRQGQDINNASMCRTLENICMGQNLIIVQTIK